MNMLASILSTGAAKPGGMFTAPGAPGGDASTGGGGNLAEMFASVIAAATAPAVDAGSVTAPATPAAVTDATAAEPEADASLVSELTLTVLGNGGVARGEAQSLPTPEPLPEKRVLAQASEVTPPVKTKGGKAAKPLIVPVGFVQPALTKAAGPVAESSAVGSAPPAEAVPDLRTGKRAEALSPEVAAAPVLTIPAVQSAVAPDIASTADPASGQAIQAAPLAVAAPAVAAPPAAAPAVATPTDVVEQPRWLQAHRAASVPAAAVQATAAPSEQAVADPGLTVVTARSERSAAPAAGQRLQAAVPAQTTTAAPVHEPNAAVMAVAAARDFTAAAAEAAPSTKSNAAAIPSAPRQSSVAATQPSPDAVRAVAEEGAVAVAPVVIAEPAEAARRRLAPKASTPAELTVHARKAAQSAEAVSDVVRSVSKPERVEGAATPVSVVAAVPASNVVAPLATPIAEAAVPRIEAAASTAPQVGAVLSDQVIDMGVDGQWIDRLAREITQVAEGTGHSRFQLMPPNLGRIQVDLWQGENGGRVHLLTETDEAASRLRDGQSTLQADARLAALSLGQVVIERAASGNLDGQRDQRDPQGQPQSQSQQRGSDLAQNGQQQGQPQQAWGQNAAGSGSSGGQSGNSGQQNGKSGDPRAVLEERGQDAGTAASGDSQVRYA